MANNIPSQTRTVDPYASYDSNIVNQLTRIITRETDCIDSIHSIDITPDLVEQLHHFYISPGQCYKDDVIIQITSTFRVDMTDPDFYIPTFPGDINPFNEEGYYHILLSYDYVKAKPAPQAKIYIIKPSQRLLYNPDNYILLKIIQVAFLAPSTFYIVDFFNTDPEAGYESFKRSYLQFYCGTENTLPVFNQTRDQSRIVYAEDDDMVYFGGENGWICFDSLRYNIDTTLCSEGQLVYVNVAGVAEPALADNPLTFADGFCLTSDTVGQIKLYGYAEGVPIEPGVIDVATGDLLYLSASVPGRVTNVPTLLYPQYVGRCITSSYPEFTCTMLFEPGNTGGGTGTTYEFAMLAYQELLAESVFNKMFMDLFDSSDFIDGSSTVTWNPATKTITGSIGEEFISSQLTTSPDDISEYYLSKAQVSMNPPDDTSKMIWYLSNDNGTYWEETDVNVVHTFSTVRIPYILGTGLFEIGEWVEGLTSGKRGVVCADVDDNLLLSNETGTSSWQIGETIQSIDSTATCLISASPVSRTSTDYVYLRAKAVLTDTASIEDYCVLYDLDTEKDETSVANEKNIETLYGDLYEVPSQNNDGLRLYPFSDTTSIQIINIVHTTDTIVKAVARLDNLNGIGSLQDGDSTPSISENYRTFAIDSTSVYDITTFTDSYEGQEFNVVNSGSGSVTIKNGAGMNLASGSDCILGYSDTICLIYINSIVGFVEKSRSNN